MTDPETLARYKHFVRERHRIWERRMAGEPGPWTNDPILARQKFCNVFRVLDHGSQFAVRELYYGDDQDTLTADDAFARAWLFRLTNTPDGWERTRQDLGRFPLLSDMMDGTLREMWHEYRRQGISLYRSAYVPGKIPTGSSNWEYGLDRLQAIVEHGDPFTLQDFYNSSAADRVALLEQVPSNGPFIAQQLATDFHYSAFGGDLENESVVSGPGSIRGTQRITGQRGKGHTVDFIKDLQDMWAQDLLAPTLRLNSGSYRPPSLMDVQNTLCEFEKYERSTSNSKAIIRRYSPRADRPYDNFVLPHHWK